MQVRISEIAFDPQGEIATFVKDRRDSGALASFIGYCRDETAGKAVGELFVEQYPGFTIREIERLAGDVSTRFHTPDLLVVHRVGVIAPGEPIVLVAALSVHRAAALDAVKVMMDYLKTDAPLWKRETGPDGVRWIEPRSDDYARREKAGSKA